MYQGVKKIVVLVALLIVGAISGVSSQTQSTPPRLVVNIVVGSMSAADLERYSAKFGVTGFNRLRHEGAVCSAAHYSYQGGDTPTSLATISTGATPSIHGVTGYTWYDRGESKRVDLTYDESVRNLEYDLNIGGESPHNLVAPTLAETLRGAVSGSRTVTFALDAASAITFNGGGGSAFWVDPRTSEWATSTAYMEEIPEWVAKINKRGFEADMWRRKYPDVKSYVNSVEYGLDRGIECEKDRTLPKKEQAKSLKYNYLAYTPAGNSRVLEMAWSGIQAMNLGGDATVDMMNIYLDSSRNITSRYGTDSQEVEDMYYRLDSDLGRFIDQVRSWVMRRDVIFVLTSDGGSSPASETTKGDKLFNKSQFEVILNTFLGAKYGAERWVLGYENRSIYLNHKLIYQSKLDLEKMQSEVATFALQFRGVSHAVTATTLSGSYFAGGYGAMIQRGFYPRRSGDVVINLMPGWIEQRDGVRSHSGSIYSYDTHVPLIVMGSGIESQEIKRRVEITSIAPTVARIMKILPPVAVEGERIIEITDKE